MVVGPSIVHATVYSIYTELNAKLQMQASQMARDIETLDEPELFEAGGFDVNRPWQHYRSRLPNFHEATSLIARSSGSNSDQP